MTVNDPNAFGGAPNDPASRARAVQDPTVFTSIGEEPLPEGTNELSFEYLTLLGGDALRFVAYLDGFPDVPIDPSVDRLFVVDDVHGTLELPIFQSGQSSLVVHPVSGHNLDVAPEALPLGQNWPTTARIIYQGTLNPVPSTLPSVPNLTRAYITDATGSGEKLAFEMGPEDTTPSATNRYYQPQVPQWFSESAQVNQVREIMADTNTGLTTVVVDQATLPDLALDDIISEGASTVRLDAQLATGTWQNPATLADYYNVTVYQATGALGVASPDFNWTRLELAFRWGKATPEEIPAGAGITVYGLPPEKPSLGLVTFSDASQKTITETGSFNQLPGVGVASVTDLTGTGGTVVLNLLWGESSAAGAVTLVENNPGHLDGAPFGATIQIFGTFGGSDFPFGGDVGISYIPA